MEALTTFADGSGMGAEEEQASSKFKSKEARAEAEGFVDAATGKVRQQP